MLTTVPSGMCRGRAERDLRDPPPPPHPPEAHGDFLERFKEEVIFQMSLKGEKVFKVEKDVLGISGMA